MENEISQQATQTVEHLDDAVQQVSEASVDAPNEEVRSVLKDIKDVLEGVRDALKRANELAEKSLAPSVESAQNEAPDVELEIPVKPERKIRRNGRKVLRR
jgi:ferritin